MVESSHSVHLCRLVKLSPSSNLALLAKSSASKSYQGPTPAAAGMGLCLRPGMSEAAI